MFATNWQIACNRKDMKVKVVILAALFLCNFVQAMEVSRGICHLAMLPADVRNLIVEYLDFETEAEFIARTKILSDPRPYFKHLPEIPFKFGMGMEPPIGGFSPDRSKVICLRRHNDMDGSYRRYDLYDIRTKQFLCEKYFEKPLRDDGKGHRACIALSQDSNLLAEIKTKTGDPQGWGCKDFKLT